MLCVINQGCSPFTNLKFLENPVRLQIERYFLGRSKGKFPGAMERLKR